MELAIHKNYIGYLSTVWHLSPDWVDLNKLGSCVETRSRLVVTRKSASTLGTRWRTGFASSRTSGSKAHDDETHGMPKSIVRIGKSDNSSRAEARDGILTVLFEWIASYLPIHNGHPTTQCIFWGQPHTASSQWFQRPTNQAWMIEVALTSDEMIPCASFNFLFQSCLDLPIKMLRYHQMIGL